MINRETVLQTLKCLPNEYPHLLEKEFPHVLEKIVKLWYVSVGEVYLVDLLNPNYSGGRFYRRGFPVKAWHEILLLLYKKPLSKSTS